MMREQLLAMMSELSDTALETAARSVGIHVEKTPEIGSYDPLGGINIWSWQNTQVGVPGEDNRPAFTAPQDWKVMAQAKPRMVRDDPEVYQGSDEPNFALADYAYGG